MGFCYEAQVDVSGAWLARDKLLNKVRCLIIIFASLWLSGRATAVPRFQSVSSKLVGGIDTPASNI